MAQRFNISVKFDSMYIFNRLKYTILLLLLVLSKFMYSDKIDSLKRLLNTTTNDTSKLFYYVYLSNICDITDIKKYAEPAIELSEVLLKKYSNEPKALVRIKEWKALSLSSMAYLYDIQGNVGTALDMYQLSLLLYKDIGSEKEAAYILSNMAYVYEHQGDYDRSRKYYNQSLDILLKLGDKLGAAGTIHNMGNIYVKGGDLHKAKQFYIRSLKLYEELNNTRGKVSSLNQLSGIQLRQNELSEALKNCNRSLSMVHMIKDQFVYISTFINAGSIYEASGKQKEGLRYLDTALRLAKEYGFPELIRNSEERLAKIYEKMGDFRSCYQHYRQFILYKDSLANDETKRASIKSQYKFDFEKKENELKLQQEKDRLIAESKQRSQKIILYSVITVLLLVLVFSVFIYRSLQKNKEANRIITKQNKLVESRNTIIEEKQKEILDSINYAKRIQYTLLAHADFLKQHLPEHFVYFNPKDIVSGDFYWATSVGSGADERFYLAVCDSTGHGVPGAFMSLLNISFLSEAINEKGIREPNKVFDFVRQRLIDNISKEGQKDGFDGILLCFEKNVSLSRRTELAEAGVEVSSARITYAAANNAPVLVRKKPDTESIEAPVAEFIEAPADRMPVGVGERQENFNLYTIEAKQGDMLYIYTDGYADQFGGPKGKKYMYKRLNTLLLELSTKSMNKQHQALSENFVSWKGQLEQVDDVCIIGVRL